MLDPHAIQRALFIRTDRLGETLLNLPAVAALKAALPNASVTMLVGPGLAELMGQARAPDEILTYTSGPRGWWWVRAAGLAALLRPRRFDLAIVSNAMRELHVAVWLAGVPVRIGYGRKWGGLLTHRLVDRKRLGERHEVEYNLELLDVAGLPTAIPQQSCFTGLERERSSIVELLRKQGVNTDAALVVIHPGSSNPSKRWPVDRFHALIRYLMDEAGVPVALIGGSEERESMRGAAPVGPGVADLVGRLNLVQLAALLEHARVLISNDSGPVHLAAAVGTPAIALFGSAEAGTCPRRWGPWGQQHTVIWKPSMDAIAVDDVVSALTRHLG